MDWLLVVINLTQARGHLGRDSLSRGRVSIRLACWQVCRDIFMINDCSCRARDTVGSATHGQVRLVA